MWSWKPFESWFPSRSCINSTLLTTSHSSRNVELNIFPQMTEPRGRVPAGDQERFLDGPQSSDTAGNPRGDVADTDFCLSIRMQRTDDPKQARPGKGKRHTGRPVPAVDWRYGWLSSARFWDFAKTATIESPLSRQWRTSSPAMARCRAALVFASNTTGWTWSAGF